MLISNALAPRPTLGAPRPAGSSFKATIDKFEQDHPVGFAATKAGVFVGGPAFLTAGFGFGGYVLGAVAAPVAAHVLWHDNRATKAALVLALCGGLVGSGGPVFASVATGAAAFIGASQARKNH